jgi:hypothetical protein
MVDDGAVKLPNLQINLQKIALNFIKNMLKSQIATRYQRIGWIIPRPVSYLMLAYVYSIYHIP